MRIPGAFLEPDVGFISEMGTRPRRFTPAYPFPVKPWSGWYPPATADDPDGVVNFETDEEKETEKCE